MTFEPVSSKAARSIMLLGVNKNGRHTETLRISMANKQHVCEENNNLKPPGRKHAGKDKEGRLSRKTASLESAYFALVHTHI